VFDRYSIDQLGVILWNLNKNYELDRDDHNLSNRLIATIPLLSKFFESYKQNFAAQEGADGPEAKLPIKSSNFAVIDRFYRSFSKDDPEFAKNFFMPL
jgi:hypothetical protein